MAEVIYVVRLHDEDEDPGGHCSNCRTGLLTVAGSPCLYAVDGRQMKPICGDCGHLVAPHLSALVLLAETVRIYSGYVNHVTIKGRDAMTKAAERSLVFALHKLAYEAPAEQYTVDTGEVP
jgi:hypothetical protein